MFVDSRSPKKQSLFDFFHFWAKMCQNGGGPRSHIFDVFSVFFSLVPLWVPLGSFSLTFGLPGHHFGTFLAALGIILAPLGPTKMMPRQCKIQWKWILKPSTVATHKRLLRTFLSLAHLNLIRYCWELTFMRWTTREPNNQRKRILKPTSLQRGGGVGPTAKWIYLEDLCIFMHI